MTATHWRNVDEIIEKSFHQHVVFFHIPDPNDAPLKLWKHVLLSAHKIGVRHLIIDGWTTVYGKSLDYALLPALDLDWTILSFEADPRPYFAQYKSISVENYDVEQIWNMTKTLDGFPSSFFTEWFEAENAKSLVHLIAKLPNTPLLVGCAKSHPEVGDYYYKTLGQHFLQLTGNIPFVVGQNASIRHKPMSDKYLPFWQPLFNLGGSGGYLLSEAGDRFNEFNKLHGAELWFIEQPQP
ncbi:MAG: hypothetical protein GC179_06580 [Anaerolineaceae bacterium]|nr:hypothetical protein [Anaerolineaceae bacterium]